MKVKKIILWSVSGLVVAGLCLGGFFYGFYNIGVKPAPTQEIRTGDGQSLRVGLISDTQLPPKDGTDKRCEEHLIDALKLLKEQNVNMIVHAGDVGDMNSSYAYKTFNNALKTVYGDQLPPTMVIMGNHDTWWNTDWDHSKPKARKFASITGESPWSHKVVNGFHFIGASPDGTKNTQGYSKEVIAWLEEQIKAAEKDTPNLPVFVVTHHNAKDTVYGSDAWYDDNLDTLFSKYPNLVSISGHSHYPILDERSIYQNQYTAFTTQGLAYSNLDKRFFDPFRGGLTDLPAREADYPMMLIMNVNRQGATVERWNVKDKKEEKADRRWTLKYPLTPDTFTYSLAQREKANQAPEMKNSKVTYDPAVPSHLYEVKKGEETLPGITFRAGTDDDFVHSYKVVLRGPKELEYTYLSDFPNGLGNMEQTVRFALDTTLPEGEYQVKVYAVDSFGLVSGDCAEGTIQLKR